jgi:hypothetical protein
VIRPRDSLSRAIAKSRPHADNMFAVRAVSLALALLAAALAVGMAGSASAAIIVTRPPVSVCASPHATFDLQMFLNEGWANSAAVKGEIAVFSSTGRKLADHRDTFARGAFSFTYVPPSVGSYRILYAWFIPAGYLSRQPVRPGTRNGYHTDRWQTAATWVTHVRRCR